MGIIFTLLEHTAEFVISQSSLKSIYKHIRKHAQTADFIYSVLKSQDIDLEKVKLLLFKIVINILINQMLKLSCYYLYIGSTNINEKNSGKI